MKRKQKIVDLQVHSTYSDGSLTPSELFCLAQKQGVEMLVITDHDGVRGMADVKKSAKKYNFPFISGIELTVTYKGEELHMLGYGFDYNHHHEGTTQYAQINNGTTIRRCRRINGL